MEAYLKSRADFGTLLQRSVVDYSEILDSLGGEASSVTLAGDDIPRSYAGNWLIFGGSAYLVTQVSPNNGTTKLTAAPPDALFDRRLLYSTGSTTIGGYIQSLILSEWKNQADAVYQTAYISCTNTDTTPFVQPELDDDGSFELLDYIRMVRRDYGIRVTATVTQSGLDFAVDNDTQLARNLVMDDGHTHLASSTFSTSSVAKITVIQSVDTGYVDENGDKIFNQTSTNWYLAEDGTASTSVPAHRASGEWITISLAACEEAEQNDLQLAAVMEEFAKNSEAHKIEFWAEAELNVNDTFKARMNGEVITGIINSKSRRRGDNRTLYKSGELITTIQERARAGNASSGSPGKPFAVGDIFTTTRAGTPEELLKYGAWTKIRTTTVSGHSVYDWLRKE